MAVLDQQNSSVFGFGVPCNWGIAQQSHYRKAIEAAGIKQFDGFVAEAIAAIRLISFLGNIRLEDGDSLLSIDVGAGTSDFAAFRYSRGVYDQITAASGDAYLAGHDFTFALAQEIAKQFRIRLTDAYDKGLNLTQVAPKDRPAVVAVWLAAEDAKKKLSVLEEVTVPVDLPKGRKSYTIARAKAAELWRDLFVRFRECVAKSLDGTDLSFGDVRYPLLVGGSSLLPGLRDELARAIGRDESDIVVSPTSEDIVSGGGSVHVYFQDAAAISLETGLGITVRDKASGSYRNLLLIEPGTVLPADGYFLERSGFEINKHGDTASLVADLFVCKAGVRAKLVPGRDTELADSEIVTLEEVETSLDTFSDGDHRVVIGVQVDCNRELKLLVRSESQQGIEPLIVPLSLSQGSRSRRALSANILLILDRSLSMHGEKLVNLKNGAKKFVKEALARGAKVGVLDFSDSANLSCPCTDNLNKLVKAIDGLKAGGGTRLGKALTLAEKSFSEAGDDVVSIACVFSDGQPTDSTTAPASRIKERCRVICVGIGKDVVKAFLVGLASTPEDYAFAELPTDILGAFDSIAELIFSANGSQNPRRPAKSSATQTPPESLSDLDSLLENLSSPTSNHVHDEDDDDGGGGDDEDDWDSIEAA